MDAGEFIMVKISEISTMSENKENEIRAAEACIDKLRVQLGILSSKIANSKTSMHAQKHSFHERMREASELNSRIVATEASVVSTSKQIVLNNHLRKQNILRRIEELVKTISTKIDDQRKLYGSYVSGNKILHELQFSSSKLEKQQATVLKLSRRLRQIEQMKKVENKKCISMNNLLEETKERVRLSASEYTKLMTLEENQKSFVLKPSYSQTEQLANAINELQADCDQLLQAVRAKRLES
eukprot:Stramenopile-MAST_4_protein_2411